MDMKFNLGNLFGRKAPIIEATDIPHQDNVDIRPTVDQTRNKMGMALYRGSQLKLTLWRNSPTVEVLRSLKNKPIEVTVYATSDTNTRIRISMPEGIFFKLLRNDNDHDMSQFVDTTHPVYSEHKVVRSFGQSFRIWIDKDATKHDVESLTQYPIVIEHLGGPNILVNLSDKWSVIRSEADSDDSDNHGYVDIQTLRTWFETDPVVSDDPRVIEVYRRRMQIAEATCVQLLGRSHAKDQYDELRKMLRVFIDRKYSLDKNMKKKGIDQLSRIMYLQNTLQKILDIDTLPSGERGLCATIAAKALEEIKND